MKILYIHQYFKTPEQPGGTRSYWNSLELIANGHEVTIIRANKEMDTFLARTEVDGIKIISVKIVYSQHMGILDRLKAFLGFMLVSTWLALKEKDIDLVIATSTPLTVGFPALVLKKLRRIPYVFEVRDLWPEVPIQMGAIKNKWAIKITRWFERSIYKNASHIIALSPGMEDGVLATGMPQDKVSMIPNMAKIDKFWSRPPNLEMAKKLQINMETFKVLYFGALGLANAIDYLLDGAALLQEDTDISFTFIGYGAMDQRIKERNLPNVRYLGGFAMEETSEIVNLCDISLVSFDNIPILATNSPNKLFDSLSAGKPIVVNSPGWTKDLVEDNECGLFVNPESTQDFADKIRLLRDSPDLRKKMGANSRKLAETQYDKTILCKQFANVIQHTKPKQRKRT